MKRLIAAGVAIGLLAALLASVDRAELLANLKATRPGPFLAALALFIPQNLIMAGRWKMLARGLAPIGWGRAIAMILGAQSLNIVLPSKLGDLSKAYFLRQTGDLDLARAGGLVVFEKLLDLAALCLLAVAGVAAALAFGVEAPEGAAFGAMAAIVTVIGMSALFAVAGLYFIPPGRLPFYGGWVAWLAARPKLAKVHQLFAGSHEVMEALQRRGARRGWICALSVLLWALHLIQIGFFFESLGAGVPPLALASLMPLAIFVGLLPISLFGLGTRDAAIIFLFGAWHPAETLLGVGFYVSLRYLIPAAAGLPFLQHYLALTPHRRDR